MALKILFIGGTGNISLPCVAESIAAGHSVSVFNRGATSVELPPGVAVIAGDRADTSAYRALGKGGFDVVCQFIAFTSADIAEDIAAFSGKVGQYVFISSASVYEKPPRHHVITEKTPTVNPFWRYSQDKIACEATLKQSRDLPWTIVRPSHTVRTIVPIMLNERDSLASRMLAGKPILVAGDGATPWTMTRCVDFAPPFVRLFGRKEALGEDFHITSDNAYTWDDIYKTLAAGLGVKADIVHVPTDTLIRYCSDWEGPLTGDKCWAALFDNRKIKSVVGDFDCEKNLGEVLKDSVAHVKKRLAKNGPQTGEHDALMDRIAKEQRGLGA